MRNLKKVLALVLAMAMSLSLAVTAGAAFNDQDKIVNTEAVEMCSVLNIINGYTDGSFKPEGNVTRAEAAKMITIALNGGKEPTLSASATPTYSDIAGHWAAKYIEYCTSLGIVAGDGAGKFNPNGNVKAVELAKMLLIALGYNAEHAKFIGANWDTNVNVVASQKDLYEDLETIDPSVAATRDTAAQMVWNALQAILVEYDYTLVSNNGTLTSQVVVKDNADKDTLLWDKYKAKISDTGIMAGVKYDDKNNDYNTTVADFNDGKAFDADVDYSALMGQNVKVVYKVKNGAFDTVYGIYATDKNDVVTAMIGDADSATPDLVELNDEEYKLAGSEFKAITPNGANVTAVPGWDTDWSKYPYFEASLIDNDNDEVYEVAVVTPFTVEEVTFIGAKTFQAGTTYTTEDVNVYEGMAEDDYVIIVDGTYTVDGKTTFTKAEVVTGEVTVINGKDYTIGGEVYTLAPNAQVGTALELTNEVEAVVVNGYIFFAEKVSGTASLDEIVYIDGAEVVKSYGSSKVMARAYDVKGVMTEIEVKSADSTSYVDAQSISATALDGLWKYELDDGKYELKSITDDTSAAPAEGDFDINKTTVSAGKDKIAGVRVNADAVVFVVDGDGDVSVKTGADVAAWGAQSAYNPDTKTGSLISVDAYANNTNGVAYVALAAIVMADGASDPDGAADAVYAYVVETLGQTQVDDVKYNSYKVWTATGEQTITVKVVNDKATPVAGEFVVFENDILNDVTGYYNAVTGIAGDSLYFNGNVNEEWVIDEDTQIIFINAKDKTGAEGALKLAVDLDNKNGDENNVYSDGVRAATASDDNVITFMFVDVNNDIQKNVIK